MTRYLVSHDYGMGGLWWWITAGSPEEITLTLSDVEVVSDAELLQRADGWNLEEVDLSGPLPAPLDRMRDERVEQRKHPDFGATAGRSPIYLRMADEDGTWLMELGADGRRLRQIEVPADGPALKTEDWPFNPPFDLYDPQYAAMEMEAAVFETAWRDARPDPDPW
ncbi:hypothetical protein SAMN05421504_101697 [Amycolatopsis xylanica]|uniref:Uncharacterized protein n=1 Tax=Amycolatopsis xylanica TaxID=589385 RepID=A0A1H2TVP7_9PSEU|nr:hypothetical protein [Amycolatopsis xylanica]SDW47828.1 hypothetical protein SAMN05421504_101697 [Amycolatopsis xylanica]